jgi:hypothetical protein
MTCWYVLIYQFDVVTFICHNDLNNLFYNGVTFWGMINKDLTEEKVIKILVYSCIILFDFFQKIVLFLNFSLCLDLYLSFKRPFYPNARRLAKYFAATILIVMVTMPATIGAVLESPSGLFKIFFQPLVLRTDNDKNIIGNKILESIASGEYTAH